MKFESVPCGKSNAYRVTEGKGKDRVWEIVSRLPSLPREAPYDPVLIRRQPKPYLFGVIQGEELDCCPVLLVVAVIGEKKCVFIVFHELKDIWLVPMQFGPHLFPKPCVFECILQLSKARLQFIDCLMYHGELTNGMTLQMRMILAWITVRCWWQQSPRDRLELDVMTYIPFDLFSEFIGRCAKLDSTTRILFRSENGRLEHEYRMIWESKKLM